MVTPALSDKNKNTTKYCAAAAVAIADAIYQTSLAVHLCSPIGKRKNQ